MRANFNQIVPQTCGVGILGIFRVNAGTALNTIVPMGGCGWVIASFTPERPEYEQAYKELCKRWRRVYQSPVRVNKRTNRQFFFCIFDTESKP
jgi:hypothetical protein